MKNKNESHAAMIVHMKWLVLLACAVASALGPIA
jgi:hypothetical protein